MLSINFLNAESGIVGSAEIGPVSGADRGHQTGLVFRQQSGIVPAGTRTIDVKLTMTRYNGTYNDGYADNLSLILLGPAPFNIFQWEYVDPQDPSQGKRESNVLAPGGYGLHAEPGLQASCKNLTKAYPDWCRPHQCQPQHRQFDRRGLEPCKPHECEISLPQI